VPLKGVKGVQANDFGSEVIPGAQAEGKNVRAYLYDGYWEDIGTIKAFYDANLALTDVNPKFSYDPPPC
jgi:glucose-1-phosphate adenylyltransferase